LGSVTYSEKAVAWSKMEVSSAQSGTPHNAPEDTMNSIIYIVGLVVIIGVILSYFGFR
jgi:hypothetical protein